MGKFTNQLNEKQEYDDRGYKRAIWKYLVAYGGALKEQGRMEEFGQFDTGSYYSSMLAADFKLTEEALVRMRAVGVDIDKSTDPAPGWKSTFNGTFTSTELRVPTLHGKLVLNDGWSVWWGMTRENDNFADLIRRLVAPDGPDFDAAMDELSERLEKVKTMYREMPMEPVEITAHAWV